MAGRRPGRHYRVMAAALAAAAVLVAGCGQSGQSGQTAGRGGQVLTGRTEPLGGSSMSPAQVTAAGDAFGLALFAQVCRQMPGSGLLLSPESAAEALGMLYAGAKGPTATAIGRLLHLPPWSPGLVGALSRHTTALAGLHQIAVSNHVFEQSGQRPAQRVLDDLQTAYRAALWLVDFHAEPATTQRINAVVAGDTHGLIPALFQAPLPQSTGTVLTNALYLKARWRDPFPPASPGQFRTAADRIVSVPMMSSADPVASYRSAAGWQSGTLPYAGGQVAAVALLPPAGPASCAVPTLTQWLALTAGPSSRSAKVELPSLHQTQTWDSLQVTLAAMGLPLDGDYTGLGPQDSQISEIVQQDTMDVTPVGTTAAAATGVGVGSSALAGPVMSLTFNRPFLLMLEDTATHSLLFLARVTDPTQR